MLFLQINSQVLKRRIGFDEEGNVFRNVLICWWLCNFQKFCSVVLLFSILFLELVGSGTTFRSEDLHFIG